MLALLECNSTRLKVALALGLERGTSGVCMASMSSAGVQGERQPMGDGGRERKARPGMKQTPRH